MKKVTQKTAQTVVPQTKPSTQAPPESESRLKFAPAAAPAETPSSPSEGALANLQAVREFRQGTMKHLSRAIVLTQAAISESDGSSLPAGTLDRIARHLRRAYFSADTQKDELDQLAETLQVPVATESANEAPKAPQSATIEDIVAKRVTDNLFVRFANLEAKHVGKLHVSAFCMEKARGYANEVTALLTTRLVEDVEDMLRTYGPDENGYALALVEYAQVRSRILEALTYMAELTGYLTPDLGVEASAADAGGAP
jgi:hypothetical protein